MIRLPLYCYYTPGYDVLVQEWFLPGARREYRVRLMRGRGKRGVVCYKERGWAATVRRKIKYFAGAISRNKGKVLVFSDPDVQFLGRTRKELLAAIRGKDMVFQKNDPDGTACTGFFACRANSKTARFWKDVCRGIKPGADDQDVANSLLAGGVIENISISISQSGRNPYKIRWGYLPGRFFGGGMHSGKRWHPGEPLAMPAQPLVHHANWSIGLRDKLAQLRYVRDTLNARAERSDLHPMLSIIRLLQSKARFRILRMLEPSALSLQAVAAVLAVSPSTAERDLVYLCNAGFVERTASANGKSVLFRLAELDPAVDMRGGVLSAIRSWEDWNPLIARDKGKAAQEMKRIRRKA